MPNYDLVLLLKKMNEAALKSVLTRNAKYVLESGAVLTKIENLGLKQTPFTIKKKGMKSENKAHYFILNYNAGGEQNLDILDKMKRDLDVIRSNSFVVKPAPGESLNETPKPECTIHEDMLPAPYRKNVIKLLNTPVKKKKKSAFQYSPDMDFDPF